MDRTYVVTGAASGIGAATARYLRERGGRVIACDLHNVDVIADLTTIEGRAELVDGVTRLSGGKIDAIVANAGGGPAETMLSLNFFGAVATLEGLRPLLKTSPAPRAVMVSSIASLSQPNPRIIEACSNMDEPAATVAARDAIAAGKGPLDLYGSAKIALNSLVSKGRGQAGMGWRRNSAECDRARFYRYACRRVHPVRPGKKRSGGEDGTDARGLPRSS